MSDPLVSSNHGDPTTFSLSNVNAAAKSACSFLKLKTGPLSMPMHQRKCLHVLIDMGNRCGVSLINELTFLSMCPQGTLDPINVNITGAGKQQYLTCVGPPLEIQFYNKTSKNSLIYRFRTLVFCNLQLPLLLSSSYLFKIGAIINVCKKYYVPKNSSVKGHFNAID